MGKFGTSWIIFEEKLMVFGLRFSWFWSSFNMFKGFSSEKKRLLEILHPSEFGSFLTLIFNLNLTYKIVLT